MSEEPDTSISARSRQLKECFIDLKSFMDEHQPDDKVHVDATTVSDAAQRFTLWTGNMGALRSPTSRLSLDHRLIPAPEVQELVCQLLDDLQEALADRKSILLLHEGTY